MLEDVSNLCKIGSSWLPLHLYPKCEASSILNLKLCAHFLSFQKRTWFTRNLTLEADATLLKGTGYSKAINNNTILKRKCTSSDINDGKSFSLLCKFGREHTDLHSSNACHAEFEPACSTAQSMKRKHWRTGYWSLKCMNTISCDSNVDDRIVLQSCL